MFLHLKGFERILAEFKTWRLEPLIGGRFLDNLGRFWICWTCLRWSPRIKHSFEPSFGSIMTPIYPEATVVFLVLFWTGDLTDHLSVHWICWKLKAKTTRVESNISGSCASRSIKHPRLLCKSQIFFVQDFQNNTHWSPAQERNHFHFYILKQGVKSL